jgi:GWxTD domain-containing protein
MILVCIFASMHTVQAQQTDSTAMHTGRQTDSLHRIIFPTTSTGAYLPRPQRTIDLALTGGAGSYREGSQAVFQPTANADFFARTSDLDVTFGFHWGFSEPSPEFPDPSTKSLTLGLRFPISETYEVPSGFFLDAALLLIDNGTTNNGPNSDEFSTGFRAALAARTGILEFRLAGEIRQFPFAGNQFQTWGGIELGVVVNLIREEVTAPTPKDSLREELRYIATSDELEQLEKTTSSAEIDAWLDRFWQARNVTGSAQNDARIEYMHRVKIANEKYGTPRRMGVSTDQGRVLLLYGQPDRMEPANSTVYGSDRKYELWAEENRIKGYHVALFLFVASTPGTAQGTYTSHGEYREIYSNVAGEPRDVENADPTDGLPVDLPPSMKNYIDGFR